MIRLSASVAAFLWGAVAAGAHDTKITTTETGKTAFTQAGDATTQKGTPLPFKLGGGFALVDQHGNPRTEVDPDGNLQLVFFGYGSCKQICSAVFPQMAEVAQSLSARNIAITPVLITVDPVRDTVTNLNAAMRHYGPNFVGLTGNHAALQKAYDAFAVESELVFDDPFYGPVFAHGSFLYLLDAQGEVLTLIPPVLATDRVVDLIAGYAPSG